MKNASPINKNASPINDAQTARWFGATIALMFGIIFAIHSIAEATDTGQPTQAASR